MRAEGGRRLVGTLEAQGTEQLHIKRVPPATHASDTTCIDSFAIAALPSAAKWAAPGKPQKGPATSWFPAAYAPPENSHLWLEASCCWRPPLTPLPQAQCPWAVHLPTHQTFFKKDLITSFQMRRERMIMPLGTLICKMGCFSIHKT